LTKHGEECDIIRRITKSTKRDIYVIKKYPVSDNVELQTLNSNSGEGGVRRWCR